MGVKVVDFGESKEITTVEELRFALDRANVKALFFDPIYDLKDNLLLLRKAIPDFFQYDDSHGQLFHSKHYPNLIYFIQTGFDVEMGCLNYKSMFLHHPMIPLVRKTASATTDITPLYSTLDMKTISHGEALTNRTWDFAKKIIEKQYYEL